MKKNAITAMILATTMILTLMGCVSFSADTTSSSDAESVTEVTTDSESNTAETASEAASDNASTDLSGTADAATSSFDEFFTYKGETFSILDDLQTAVDKIDAVGTPASFSPEEVKELGTHIYNYDVNSSDAGFSIITFFNNDTESLGQISLMGSTAKTSKGIGIGSTVDELISAYGEPTEKTHKDSFYNYKTDEFYISFCLKDDKVYVIYYYNPDFYNSHG